MRRLHFEKRMTLIGNFIKYCQPLFRVVGHLSVWADCVLLYEEEKLQLLDKFKRFIGHVSLTADLWSSNQNLGYLGVTEHFIDEELELKKKIIHVDFFRTYIICGTRWDYLMLGRVGPGWRAVYFDIS